jgi:uncharacterized protein YfdQ (DUF2303 family)
MTTTTATLDRAALNAQVIADLAKAGVPKFTLLNEPNAATRLIWQDKTIKSLEHFMPQPMRKRGAAELADADSFATYVNAHRTPGTHLTGDANEKGGYFHALLDYHQPNTPPDPNGAPGSRFAQQQYDKLTSPSWSEHTATQTLQPTPEWARWLGAAGKDIDQRTFAEFLEDNAVDVIVPEGGKGFPSQQELMSVASTLQVKTDVRFASTVKLQNGQVTLGYTEQIEGGHGQDGKLAIPEKFGIAVAPFRGTAKYLVTVRLRYRGTGGKALFRLEIERPHKIVESAFNDVRAVIEEATGLKVLVGKIIPQTRNES